MSAERKDPLIKKIEIRNWCVLAVFVFASLVFWSYPVTLGVLLGGFVCILNFHWICRDLKAAFQGPVDRARQRVLIRYYLRLFVTAVVLFFVITKTEVNVIGLVVGLSIVVVNIIATVLLENVKKNPPRRLNREDASVAVFRQ